ncbi:luciferase domain-containing protein [Haloarchaeobius amylolyticus]|uniref:luciferase domain-containing protein n=1 Tax=Haloarchaeobius amylolyticus TaxID=1198296 RepID=UPI002270D276|nr:luciferase family protein [Haloarchaeobius amylolyticus]
MADSSGLIGDVVESLVETVTDWPHVRQEAHRYGGTAFLVDSREIGHVHDSGMLDISYLKALRDRLVEAGETGVHHLLTDSGWTTYYIESSDDFEHALWLVRLSYLYHVRVLQQRDGGRFDDVDVAAELDALDVSEAVQAAFERREEGTAA